MDTGLKELDKMLGGLKKGEVTMVAGRPSMGKSTLALSIVEHAVVENKAPCSYFSLDMSCVEVTQRLLSCVANVDWYKLKAGNLSKADWIKICDSAKKISESPFSVDDTPGISVADICSKCHELKTKNDIQSVIIDYFQLLRGSRNKKSLKEISEMSRSIKALALELDISIIFLSQLTRATENRKNHRPRISDLRGSGAIERGVDNILLLYREEYYAPTETNTGLAEIIIAGHAGGKGGTIPVRYVYEHSRFINL